MAVSQSAVATRDLPDRSQLPSALIALGLPVLAEQLLSFCVGFFDVYLSGRLSSEATSAIGLAAYVSWLASMISGLIGTGAAAVVARACGSGDWDDARRVMARSLMLGFLLGGVLLVSLWTAAPGFAWLLGMGGETRAIAIEYLRCDAVGQMFACTTFIASAALRGSGDMRTPLFVFSLTNIVNITMSVAFVYGWGPFPALGVTGIVTGTVIAHATGMTIMLCVLCSQISRLRVKLSDVRWHLETARRILRIGGPAALDGAVTFLGHFLFLMIIARLSPSGFDGATFAAHVVGVRVEAISYLPAVAWGAASASLAGRLIGAGELRLAYATGHLAVRQFLWYSTTISAVLFFAAPAIYHVMHNDPEVAKVGVPAFRLLALYQVPTTAMAIYTATLRGAGDTRFPLWCAIVSIIGIRVPVTWIGGIWLEGGLVGAWLGMGADNLTRFVLMFWRYRAGHWLKTRV